MSIEYNFVFTDRKVQLEASVVYHPEQQMHNIYVYKKQSCYRSELAYRMDRGIAQYPFVTSAQEEGGWSAPRPGRFTPGKYPVPIVQEAGWTPGSVWTCVKNLAPPRFDPRTVQPVARRYTDWATRSTIYVSVLIIYIVNIARCFDASASSSGSTVVPPYPSIQYPRFTAIRKNWKLTFWHRNFFNFFSTPVYKMWTIQEPKKVALWNKRHFEEKEMESVQHVKKISVLEFVEKI
jgi:hypothetical protein